ncbi:hypothetical protein D3C71_2120950 [compost metagenome]
MVQAGAVAGIADVHARALTHRFEALEDLDLIAVIGLGVGCHFGVRHRYSL